MLSSRVLEVVFYYLLILPCLICLVARANTESNSAMIFIRENLNDYCCHVMQKVRRYTEYSMTWHLSRANMKFDENLVIFMQL